MSFPFYEVAVHQALFAPRGYVSTCAPITRNRTDLLYANECVCMCVCVRECVMKGGVSRQQMLVFCQNNLVGIFMSCTRPQLGYRWGEGGGGGGGGVVDGCEEG